LLLAVLDGAIEDDDTGIIAKCCHIVRSINRHSAEIIAIVLQFAKVNEYFKNVRDCAFLIARPLIDMAETCLKTPQRASFSTDNGVLGPGTSVLKK
jgi:hypothetical protein